MSQYKSAIRSQPKSDQSEPSRFSSKARQLQELFPSWSNDDLQSLLAEVNGDVELAATRISEGHAEQWGSVTRKKEKKPTAPTTSKESSASSTRGDTRGGRGGRAGRGGAGRGGASSRGRGTPRGAVTNGHVASTPPAAAAEPSTAEPAQIRVVDTPDTPALTSSTSTPASWATTSANWGSADSTPTDPSPIIVAPKPAKTPATSKMSWAQIARPQEKPTLPPPPPPPSIPVQTLQQQPASETSQSLGGWEEPTTMQQPVWDDEPSAKPLQVDPWTLPESAPEEPTTKTEQREVVEHIPEVSVPVQDKPPAEPEPSPAAVPAPVKTASRPSSVSHRSSARFKTSDQPVVMPSSSSFGTGLEKIGMQFGSLSLGGESLLDGSEQETAPQPTDVAVHHEAPIASTTPPSTTSLSSLYQQPPTQSQTALSHVPLSTSVSSPAAAPSSSQPFSQQQQQQQAPVQSLLPQQSQQPPSALSQHQYSAQQHNLPAHLDQQPPSQSQANQNSNSHSNYFRQNDGPNPYFHAPTPPSAGQTPHNENPYGAFGPLQGQGSHQQGGLLGGFTNDYGYDGQRGFYDSYQQNTFSGRGLDELKGLPGTQQQQQQGPNNATQQSSGLLPASQSSSSSQQGTNQQGNGGQGGPATALGYAPPPPAPYLNYYNVPYPQNQYYGTYGQSSVGYGMSVPSHQGYPKYPPMFTGPPQQNNASSVSSQSKQQGGPGLGTGIGAGVGQSNLNPYAQSVYQNQGGVAYDDYHSQQHQPQSQHQQHSLLGQTEYGKQLYGNTSTQGFMGLAAQSGNAGAGSVPNPGRGGSPETSYKYVGKDVGVGRGGPSQQQNAQNQQGGGQGPVPQGQGFYSGNRLGGGGPQQSGHFPQGQNEYYYQHRQQQYWQ